MTEYVRRFVSSVAAQVLPTRGQRLRRMLLRQLLPYCVVETRGGLLLLNRQYKPIGWPTEGMSRVDYEDPQFDGLRLRETASHAKRCGLHNIVNKDGSFWFFYGGPVDSPWQGVAASNEYQSKLSDFIGIYLNIRGGL